MEVWGISFCVTFYAPTYTRKSDPPSTQTPASDPVKIDQAWSNLDLELFPTTALCVVVGVETGGKVDREVFKDV